MRSNASLLKRHLAATVVQIPVAFSHLYRGELKSLHSVFIVFRHFRVHRQPKRTKECCVNSTSGYAYMYVSGENTKRLFCFDSLSTGAQLLQFKKMKQYKNCTTAFLACLDTVFKSLPSAGGTISKRLPKTKQNKTETLLCKCHLRSVRRKGVTFSTWWILTLASGGCCTLTFAEDGLLTANNIQ